MYVALRGWCFIHYNRWSKTGDPDSPVSKIYGDDHARFLSKVNKTETCWLWTGQIVKSNGVPKYGKFSVMAKKVWAHRWAYEHWVGPIPVGHQIDHLCRVPACVRPDHLEAVTQAENLRRENAAKAAHV